MDLRTTIQPKSDQLNADDLVGGAKTIKITKVVGHESVDQPISIFFEGDDGKPYKPCKTMRRLLVQVWGYESDDYAGRSMTIYRDDEVKYAGVNVGGIRISHVSHIDKPIDVLITVAKSKRRPVTVNPLKVEQQEKQLPRVNFTKAVDLIKSGKKTVAEIVSISTCTLEEIAGLKEVEEVVKSNNNV